MNKFDHFISFKILNKIEKKFICEFSEFKKIIIIKNIKNEIV